MIAEQLTGSHRFASTYTKLPKRSRVQTIKGTLEDCRMFVGIHK